MMHKEEGVLTMVFIHGLFVLGKLFGGNKLTDPRVFMIIENGKRIQLSPLPGTPPFVTITSGIQYPVPINSDNQNILDLYERVTHPHNIVMPVTGVVGDGKMLNLGKKP